MDISHGQPNGRLQLCYTQNGEPKPDAPGALCSALEQAYGHLIGKEHTKRLILYTPNVLWVLLDDGRDDRKLSISEPFTANSQNPSMKEVVFATVIRELSRIQHKMEHTVDWVKELVARKKNEANERAEETEKQQRKEIEKAAEKAVKRKCREQDKREIVELREGYRLSLERLQQKGMELKEIGGQATVADDQWQNIG